MKYQVEWEKGVMDLLTVDNPIDKYCDAEGFKLAAKIDEKLYIVIKPKPIWCPNFLYKRIIRDSVELVNLN